MPAKKSTPDKAKAKVERKLDSVIDKILSKTKNINLGHLDIDATKLLQMALAGGGTYMLSDEIYRFMAKSVRVAADMLPGAQLSGEEEEFLEAVIRGEIDMTEEQKLGLSLLSAVLIPMTPEMLSGFGEILKGFGEVVPG